MRGDRGAAKLLGLAALTVLSARAQDLEPRAYSVSPSGTNFLVLSYGYSAGDVVFDPTLPVEDAKAKLNAAVVGYFRSANVFGRSGSVTLVQPYSWGTAEGLLAGEPRRVYRSGIADSRLRLAVNLFGAPAMDLKQFVKYRQRTTLGLSLTMTSPTGQYDSNKLINLGTNRWSFKPELGLSHAFAQRWILDVYGGVWMFTDNSNFQGGRRTQEPLVSTQVHLSYTLGPRLWAAFDGTFYAGGQSTVGGVVKDDRLQNTRVGGTVSVPLTLRQSLKFSYSNGAIVRVGGDFQQISVGYQYLWGPPR